MNTINKKILSFAAEHHKNQLRDDGSLYITHPISVACILMEYTSDEVFINTALCHDLLEDTNATVDEIRNVAGSEVANAVLELTLICDKAKKHETMLLKAKSYSYVARIVKIADRLDNVRDSQGSWSVERCKKYAQNGLELFDVMAPFVSPFTGLIRDARNQLQIVSQIKV